MLYRTHLGYYGINGKPNYQQMFWESFFEFMCCVWATQPLTERILYKLEAYPGAHSEDDLRKYLGESGMMRTPDVTMRTALSRLLKAGKIKRKMITRGWFRFYVYWYVPQVTT